MIHVANLLPMTHTTLIRKHSIQGEFPLIEEMHSRKLASISENNWTRTSKMKILKFTDKSNKKSLKKQAKAFKEVKQKKKNG